MKRDTFISDFAASLREMLDAERRGLWPSEKYRDDPVAFFHEVLGVFPTPDQAKIAEAVRDNDQVAVESGQKCGKSNLAVCLGLWHYCTRRAARVMMTANSKPQIDRVLWRELRVRVRSALTPIDGILAKNPESGFKAEDGREIIAVTARQIEGMAGFSGDIFLIVDEASGVSRKMWEAIIGNMTGGGKIFAISNPTKSEGPFFDAFYSKKEYWVTFRLNSEDVAKWQEVNGTKIQGLADMATIERWREEYGVDSVFYRMRVLGQFILNESGKPITVEMITAAQERFDEMPEDGQVSIGLDPAGSGTDGDETAFAIVKGKKQVGLFAFSGLTEDAIIEHARAFCKTYRDPTGQSKPRIIVDAEGPIGSSLYYRLKGVSNTLERTRPELAFDVYPVRASAKAIREPQHYDRRREELFASLAKWLGDGALLRDVKLEVELNAPSWIVDVNGKLKLTSKNELREKLGRSPDRADALALATWEPAPWLREDDGRDDKGSGSNDLDNDPIEKDDPFDRGIDPYARLAA